LSLFLESLTPGPKVQTLSSDSVVPDILDADIRSRQTLDELRVSAADSSRRWGIVTSLKPADFVEALRAARAGT
jgi:hypothetical protein